MAFLDVRGVSKRFGGLMALNNVDMSVEKGEIFGLMGANGAGKTTLFSVIAGHVAPTTGEVHFNGRRITGLSPSRICRAGICRTFQIVRPFAGLSVEENVRVAAIYGSGRGRSGASRDTLVNEALEAVGLTRQRAGLAGGLTLSGQKRLEIARALATGADLVMLDEVMAGLNPTEIGEMLETLAELRPKFLEDVVQPMIAPGAAALLDSHQDDTRVIITATSHFITEPIARWFGVDHLIATNPEIVDGRVTGRIAGTPCYQAGKIDKLRDWLRETALPYDKTWFYSDSINDLPLLEWADHPHVVHPDESLREIAEARNWPILSLEDEPA